MTEKRYEEIDVLDNVIYLDGKIIGYQELVNLLNELNDECGRLNIICNAKERTIKNLLEMGIEVEKENEHLKTIINEAYHNERTELGKSVLKQLLEAIQ